MIFWFWGWALGHLGVRSFGISGALISFLVGLWLSERNYFWMGGWLWGALGTFFPWKLGWKSLWSGVGPFWGNSCEFWVSSALFGDKTSIPREILWTFRALGLSHLLAISGLHLSLLVESILRFFKIIETKIQSPKRLLSFRWKMKIFSESLGWIYGLSLGFSPSLQRCLLLRFFQTMNMGRTLQERSLAALTLQSVLSPLSLQEKSGILSWAGYLWMSLSSPSSLWPQVAMACLVGALLGDGPLWGPISNFFLAPLFPWMISLTLLLWIPWVQNLYLRIFSLLEFLANGSYFFNLGETSRLLCLGLFGVLTGYCLSSLNKKHRTSESGY